MTTMYDLHLRVPTRLLSTVLEVIDGEGIVVKLGQIEQQKAKPSHRKQRIPGERSIDFLYVCLGTAANGLTRQQIRNLFKGRGYSDNTWSPRLNELVHAGYVEINGDAYSLSKLGREAGDASALATSRGA